MPDVRFDTYYRYDDLTRLLQEFAQEWPHLVQVHSIGASYEGRDIWLVTVTNFTTGDALAKPALWVDGNIHASEVSPSSACLYLIHRLVSAYGQEADITRCLDTRVFYICPRVNPDGAEWALSDPPQIIRSSTRPYPYEEEPIEGLVREDIDGDGRLLTMRLRDDNGPWKVSEEDARLLVRRDATESGGEYYRVLPEGRIEGGDGSLIKIASPREGLDLNRNFPGKWRQEHEQQGAGPYPTSEAEVRAIVHFIANHPNITGAITFHTYGGVLLRPFGDRSDEEFVAEDLWTYQKIGQKGTELTGYPNVSVFHDFRYHPKEVMTGAFDDWLVDHFAIFAWTVEIWSPQREAGMEDYKFIDWYREHPLEDDLKLLKWNDEALGGKGFVDWHPFEHPTLGHVEIGGWDSLYAFRNPPPAFLERELAKFPEWVTWHLLISPLLSIKDVTAEPLGDDSFLVRVIVNNLGWLPTYVMKSALEKKRRGVVAEIELPEGITLVSGKVREELGELEGRAHKPVIPSGWTGDPTDDRVKAEWVVRGVAGDTLTVTARHERAGQASMEVVLGETA